LNFLGFVSFGKMCKFTGNNPKNPQKMKMIRS